MSKYEFLDRRVPIEDGNIALVQDLSKCKNCSLCRKACAVDMGVFDYYDLTTNGDHPICIHCGQCASICPFDSINERSEIDEVKAAIADPNKIVIFQTAPAVRVGLGEEFGLEAGTFVEGKMVAALRKLGGDYILDTNFGADMTIMEEASELLERVINSDAVLPQFTSCCPAWVKFLETNFPELTDHLSSCKSPQQMAGAVFKTYGAKVNKIDAKDIYSISIMPCTCKKFECDRPEMDSSGYRDVDAVLTTRELAYLIKDAGIDFNSLEEIPFESPLGVYTGAGTIFGVTGGVMEAALRSAHYLVTGRNPDPDAFKIVRNPGGQPGVVEAEIQLGDATVRAAVVSGLGNTRKLIEAIEHGEVHYDFVEVMACPGGCVGGGGQPIHDGEELARTRGENLYFLDKNAPLRFSHENPDVLRLYRDFLEKPLSHKSHMLLHTDHNAWEMPR